jgi:hypothetical protein
MQKKLCKEFSVLPCMFARRARAPPSSVTVDGGARVRHALDRHSGLVVGSRPTSSLLFLGAAMTAQISGTGQPKGSEGSRVSAAT